MLYWVTSWKSLGTTELKDKEEQKISLILGEEAKPKEALDRLKERFYTFSLLLLSL